MDVVTWPILAMMAAVVGGAFTIWWRIVSQVDKARNEVAQVASVAQAKADLTAVHLAEYKTHVAETYISKAGHRESTEQILSAINRIDERLDRAFDGRSSAPRSSAKE